MLSPKEKEILRLRSASAKRASTPSKRSEALRGDAPSVSGRSRPKALQKLRHPLRGRNLRAFIEN